MRQSVAVPSACTVLLAIGVGPYVSAVIAEEARLAVIGAEGGRTPQWGCVNRLEVALSQQEGIAVVERNEIDKILREQRISAMGLTRPSVSIRLGQLLDAQFFLYLEKLNRMKEPTYRAQVIEAATGIVLGSVFLDEATLTNDMSPVIRAARSATTKARAASANRHYITVLDFQSEEPGRFLDGLADAIEIFLMADLVASPGVFVLDREHLSRLVEERELSGTELRLRRAAHVLSASVKRMPANRELVVTIRARRIASGEEEHVSVSAPADDLAAIRQAVLSAVLHKLGQAPRQGPALDPRAEASIFAARVLPLMALGEYEAAARCAEAAHALYPAHETRYWCALAWQRAAPKYLPQDGATKAAVPTETKVRVLSALLRSRSFVFEMHRKRGNERFLGEGKRYFTPTTRWGLPGLHIEIAPDETEALRLREELLEQEYRMFRFRVEQGRRLVPQPEAVIAPWADACAVACRFPHRPQRMVELFRGTIDAFVNLPKAGRLTEPRFWVIDRWKCAFSSYREHRETVREVFTPICLELVQHDDPYLRIFAHEALASMGAEDPLESAHAIVDTFTSAIPPSHPYRDVQWPAREGLRFFMDRALGSLYCRPSRPDAPLRRKRRSTEGKECEVIRRSAERAIAHIASRDRPTNAIRACRRVLDPLIEARDAERLGCWEHGVVDRLRRLLEKHEGLAQADAMLEQILRVLKPPGSGKACKERLAMIRSLRSHRQWYADRLRREPVRDPAWQEYVIRTLPVRLRPSGLEPAAEIVVKNDRLYSVHVRGTQLTVVGQHFPDGGRERQLGTLEISKILCDLVAPRCVSQRWLRRPKAVVGGENLYVATFSGLAVFPLAGGQSRVLTERDGLPGSQLCSLGWFRNKLYFGLHSSATGTTGRGRSALASYDPRNGSCELLASNTAVAQRSELDGGSGYVVLSLLPDEKRECLWLSVQHNAWPSEARGGLWCCVPRTGDLKREVEAWPGPLAWADGKIAFLQSHGPHLFNPDTSAVTWVLNADPVYYADDQFPAPPTLGGHSTPGVFVFDGPRLITSGYERTLLCLHRHGKRPAPLASLPGARSGTRFWRFIPTPHGILGLTTDDRAYLIQRKNDKAD